MPRFAILAHDHPFQHWDFLLEAGDLARTWRLDRPPEIGQTVRAEPIGDHRLLYLDYEGPVSGGRGTVTRWDSGEFEWVTDVAGEIVVLLVGSRLRGMANLRRTEPGWEWEFRG
jgi:hypothetical protein